MIIVAAIITAVTVGIVLACKGIIQTAYLKEGHGSGAGEG